MNAPVRSSSPGSLEVPAHARVAALPAARRARKIVRSRAGELVDVTLSASQSKLRFIAHPGSERDFFASLRCPRPFHERAESIPDIEAIPFNTAAAWPVAQAHETSLGDGFR